VKKANRKLIVFTTLIGVLTLTSALLLALAPAPLTPDASSSLFAIDAPESMDVIFQSQQASAKPARWKYVYVHHSRTASGNAVSLSNAATGLGDHFVIGNGDGAIDGEIQIGQRWSQQLSANPPPGARGIDPACISVCVVGDFDRTVPTPTQLRRLAQLVNALQGRLDIPAGQVLLMSQAGSAAGMGKYFPATAFREQLLP
jgi:N-acetylmuramoyl-L-alanine amidase